MSKSIDGYETKLTSPVRAIFRALFKRKFLGGPMSAGFKLPARAQALLIPGPTDLAKGVADIRRAINRLKTESDRAISPVLGPLTSDEWNQLHCRHSELHLGFLVPIE
jgi:hypothetical protein